MKSLYNLKEMLCNELEEMTQKDELSMGDLDIAHKLTNTIKNIGKIEMLEDGDGYSRGGDWEARGRFGRYDEGGSSYARRGTHYVRGHYSRDDGGYSEHSGSLMDELESLKRHTGNQNVRDLAQRLMDEMNSR